jgi:hypothetical protein
MINAEAAEIIRAEVAERYRKGLYAPRETRAPEKGERVRSLRH